MNTLIEAARALVANAASKKSGSGVWGCTVAKKYVDALRDALPEGEAASSCCPQPSAGALTSAAPSESAPLEDGL